MSTVLNVCSLMLSNNVCVRSVYTITSILILLFHFDDVFVYPNSIYAHHTVLNFFIISLHAALISMVLSCSLPRTITE